MALPTKEERVRRKKVMQAAGIRVPNTDSSWGPWWEKQWNKAITHTKTNDYYGRPSVWNFMRRTWDQATSNTTYKAEPQPIGGTIQAADTSLGAQIKRTINNWQREGDPVRDIILLLMPDPSKPIRAGRTVVKAAPQLVKSVPKLFTKEGVKKGLRTTAQTVVRQAPKIGTSLAVGSGVDKVSEAVTGKSWAENASNIMSSMMGFHIEPIFGDFTNPGYIIGYKGAPLIGREIWKPIAKDLTPRVYKYVSPSGYFNSKMSRKEEAKNILRSFIKREKIDINADPVWISEGIGKTTGKGYNMPYLSSKAETQFRDDAFRKYLGLPERPGHNLYLDNGDGTWSYNNNYVQTIRRRYPTSRDIIYNMDNKTTAGVPRQPVVFVEPSELGLPLKPNKPYLAGDFLTGNGGMVSYSELGNGTSQLFDIWDVQPFIDPARLGNSIGRIGNYLFPEFELSTALGKNAKPFIMRTTFVPEGTTITNSKNMLRFTPTNEIDY